jgi:hypothetical protein
MTAACARNLRDATLTIEDGTGTPNTLLIPISDGNVSWTEHNPTVTVLNRGKLFNRRQGNDKEVDVSFEVTFAQYSYQSGGSGTPSVRDVLLQAGPASSWVTTDAICDIYATNLKFEIKNPADPTNSEILMMDKFTVETLAFKEGDPDKLTVTGKCFVTTLAPSYGVLGRTVSA